MEKSKGVTETERMLADFGDRTFLRLWSYANPYKDDGHEMCDLFAVFGDDVFIFFDREIVIPEDDDKDPDVLWDRWKRNVIDRQVRTAHGVERYIRMGRPIFLDAKKEHPFPIPIDVNKATFHKIIVAHGAKEACERASADNVYGSLAILYVDVDAHAPPPFPFQVSIDKKNPVHILDSHNLSIVLTELDTVIDFSRYLHEKMRAIAKFGMLLYCGEEDLLAHYLADFDEVAKRHTIGPKEEGDFTGLSIEEGAWHGFIETDVYKSTKAANKISYGWDELIQRTCQNAMDGTLQGNSDILKGQSAIYEMVKEPRFMRRGLYEQMVGAIQRFPDRPPGTMSRNVTFLPSYQANVAYVFLQLAPSEAIRTRSDYREKRRTMLEIACGAAKNKFPHLIKVIGIVIDAPKYSDGWDGEDFILMPCETWGDELRDHYEEQNKHVGFFATPNMRVYRDTVNEFVQPSAATVSPVQSPKGWTQWPMPMWVWQKV